MLARPHGLDEDSVLLGEGALHAERVVAVDVLLVGVGEEVLGEGHAVAEALQRGVHEAGVAEVVQARQALCLWLRIRSIGGGWRERGGVSVGRHRGPAVAVAGGVASAVRTVVGAVPRGPAAVEAAGGSARRRRAPGGEGGLVAGVAALVRRSGAVGGAVGGGSPRLGRLYSLFLEEDLGTVCHPRCLERGSEILQLTALDLHVEVVEPHLAHPHAKLLAALLLQLAHRHAP
mmetsp:Transcript_22203/g.87453  ORF Transcript_22203/g.87453 Transcript_22203/m.87453 type:complete len:232 (+) Transcript_22203:1895-2590(+)